MKIKIICIALLITFTPLISNAQIPIGGKILASYECTCSGGWFMLIFDYSKKLPIPVVFQVPFSFMRPMYNIFTPGVNVLGSVIPGGVCSVGSAACTTVPVAGTITPWPMPGIGTTLVPTPF